MNQTNISSSNSRLQALIAMALTASTVGNTSGVHDVKVLHPYYNAVYQGSMLDNSLNHTASNIDTSSRNQLNDLENYRLIRDLGERLVTRSKDIDSQIAKIVDDNFWDLI